jgi:uncharacterized membrane protein
VPRLRWQPAVTSLLCLVGIGISIYLTISHFDAHLLTCPVTSATINCEKVTTSPQSEIFGVIPVAMLGLFFFVPMLALCVPPAWSSPHRIVHLARLAGSIVGVGTILYLIYAELFQIKAICLWCSTVHFITLVLFVIIATASPIVLSRAPVDEFDDESWQDEPAMADEGG